MKDGCNKKRKLIKKTLKFLKNTNKKLRKSYKLLLEILSPRSKIVSTSGGISENLTDKRSKKNQIKKMIKLSTFIKM